MFVFPAGMCTPRAVPSRRPGGAATLCTRIYKHEYVHVPDRVYVWRIRIDRLFRGRGMEVVVTRVVYTRARRAEKKRGKKGDDFLPYVSY